MLRRFSRVEFKNGQLREIYYNKQPRLKVVGRKFDKF